MTDKELKDMDETTSMDTTAAAESAAETVTANAVVDDALLSDVDELPFDVDFDETTNVDTTSAPAPADGGADVVAANADHVNAMLSLATPRESTDDDSSPDYIETPRSASSATAVSTHIDREVKVGDEDLNLLRAYPTLSLHDVTYRDRKTGRTPVEHLTCAFEAGTVSAILVPDGDDMARTAMVGLLSGLLMPESGHLMNRSAEYLSIEPLELRGHRIGLVPQRFAVRGDLSPVRNLVYAMDASNRNFLKPKPVLARELLLASGLDETLLDNRVDSLNEVDRRRVNRYTYSAAKRRSWYLTNRWMGWRTASATPSWNCCAASRTAIRSVAWWS